MYSPEYKNTPQSTAVREPTCTRYEYVHGRASSRARARGRRARCAAGWARAFPVGQLYGHAETIQVRPPSARKRAGSIRSLASTRTLRSCLAKGNLPHCAAATISKIRRRTAALRGRLCGTQSTEASCTPFSARVGYIYRAQPRFGWSS